MTDIGILDIEASGLHFDSYPIEVAVLWRGECKSWLIKPEPTWQYWCETAESMHGISREELEINGLPAFDVASQLNAFLTESDTVLYSDAHRWDEDWIDTLYHTVKIKRPFFVDSIYDLMGNHKADKFHSHFLQLAESGRFRQHRAADDVQMIYQAYLHTMEKRR